jgi:hypothetical protein
MFFIISILSIITVAISTYYALEYYNPKTLKEFFGNCFISLLFMAMIVSNYTSWAFQLYGINIRGLI